MYDNDCDALETSDMIQVTSVGSSPGAAEQASVEIHADPGQYSLCGENYDTADYRRVRTAWLLDKSYQPGEVNFYYEVEISPIMVEGNVLASGDDEIDWKAEQAVISAVNSGNVWMWAVVKVTACLRLADEEIAASTYLGGSWLDEDDFLMDSYDDFCAEALSQLQRQLTQGASSTSI